MGTIEIFDSIEKFSAGEWDALCANWPSSNRAWHALIERTAAFAPRPRYFALHGPEGLRAAAACYELADLAPRASGGLLDPSRWKQLATRCGLSLLPALLIGPLGWRGRHLIVSDALGPAERAAACAELMDAIERYADERGLPLALRDVPADETELVALLDARGYRRVPCEPLAYLDVQWDSFEEYVSWLWETRGRNAGRNVRHEVNRFRKAGLVIREVQDVERFGPRMHALADAHYRRLNGRPLPFSPDHFVEAKRLYGDQVRFDGMFAAGGDDELLGMSMRIGHDEAMIAVHLAIDPQLLRRDGAFFALAFYHPIADAIDAGTRRIFYGRLNYQAKIARGCAVGDAYFCFRARGLRKLLTLPALIWSGRQALRAAPQQRGES
jgi:hypothetical protein